jgi:1L-myo-inositol 1-phosphate cytidylyltransferase
MIKQGVILASGLGSRLNSEGKNEPKPLMPIGGTALIERVINLMYRAGIENIVLVLGYRSEQIEKYVKDRNYQGISIVINPEYNKQNGISLLRSKEALNPGEPFLLSMADHIFSNDYFSRFISKTEEILDDADAVLSIDRDIEGVFDIDDATKVFTENNAILKIGKDLKAYNAIDTGLFICQPAIFDELKKIYEEKGDVSISEGMKKLADKNRFLSTDMTGFLWQDVDTPAMKYEAEQRLIDNAILSNDERGFFSNSIFDKISKEILLSIFKREKFEWKAIVPLYFIIAVFIAAISIRLEILWPSLITYFGAVVISNVFKIRDFVRSGREKEQSDYFSFPFNSSIAMIPVIYATYPVGAVVVSIILLFVIFAPVGGYVNLIALQSPKIPSHVFKTYLSQPFSFFVLAAMIILHIPALMISIFYLCYTILLTVNSAELQEK